MKKFNPHAMSLNPSREEGEDFEAYKERRARLGKMGDIHLKGFGRVLYATTKGGQPAVNQDKVKK